MIGTTRHTNRALLGRFKPHGLTCQYVASLCGVSVKSVYRWRYGDPIPAKHQNTIEEEIRRIES